VCCQVSVGRHVFARPRAIATRRLGRRRQPLRMPDPESFRNIAPRATLIKPQFHDPPLNSLPSTGDDESSHPQVPLTCKTHSCPWSESPWPVGVRLVARVGCPSRKSFPSLGEGSVLLGSRGHASGPEAIASGPQPRICPGNLSHVIGSWHRVWPLIIGMAARRGSRGRPPCLHHPRMWTPLVRSSAFRRSSPPHPPPTGLSRTP